MVHLISLVSIKVKCRFAISAGVFCAIVSHPADTIVSKLNQDKGSNFMTIAKNLGLLGKSLVVVWDKPTKIPRVECWR